MSDEIEIPDATPASEPQAPEEARLERSTERLERLVGIPQPSPAEERPTPETPPAAAPVTAPRPGDHPATRAWRTRLRNQARDEVTPQVLARIEQRLEQLDRSATAPPEAAPAGPEDPEPQAEQFRDDWSYQQAWIGWNARKDRREMLAELRQEVGPVLDHVRRAHETQAEYQQRLEHQQAVHQEISNRRDLMVQSEADYVATPEGEGYYDRFLWYYGYPGSPEHGVAPIDGTNVRALVRAGLPLQDARRANWLSVQALGTVAMNYGIPPALLVDSQIREILDSAGAVPGNGNGHAAQPAAPAPAAHPAARKGQQEIRQLQAAARAAGEAGGSLKDGASGKTQQINFRSLKGRAAVEEALKARYGKNWAREGVHAYRRALNELRVPE